MKIKSMTTTTITTNLTILLIILIDFNQSTADTSNIANKRLNGRINCRERNRLIQNDNNDLYNVVDAIVDDKVVLQCHYCNENDDGQPKIWYKINNFTTLNYHEVQMDTNNDPKRNRIHTNLEHSLIINNFTQNDTGLYTCQRLNDENIGEKYNYFVDLAFDDKVPVTTGNLSDWLQYCEDYLQPINQQFKTSQSAEFVFIRDKLNVHMQLITDWSTWSACQVCGGITKDRGIRKKLGFCRIKIVKNTLKNQPTNEAEILIRRLNMFGCHSETFNRILPGISNRTRIIPDFLQIQPCEGTCNPNAEGVDQGWKSSKKFDYKYRKTVVLPEGDTKSFSCPEATLENVVVWKKNGNSLEPGKFLPENPDTMIDTFNTIYFTNVKLVDEANYTCIVDDVKMQRIMLFVAQKSKLFNQVFVRYIIYLTMILSLILPCYIGGLIIACSRRHFFKDYQQLQDEEKEFEGVLTHQR